MYFSKTAILATIAALAINHVTATALNSIAACQRPHNEHHKENDGCAYIGGPSDEQSPRVDGTCIKGDEGLYCRAGHEL
ncbi:hypothetical protein B0H66DRAFT_568944 [Apodospora peruviana]|uniref:Uncharacterized protein n=1 Tax=Apodospora peruviana TaxID=516989 RepID=A0AAE0LZN9_9PEZI|nr:hypothetical protein B0H66DRAFT_568944 [Apodospora peruviana]